MDNINIKSKLDKFYNLVSENETDYSDNFSELIDSIIQTKKEGKISDADARILLQLALSKQIKQEFGQLSKWTQWLDDLGETKEKSFVLFNLESKEKKYA